MEPVGNDASTTAWGGRGFKYKMKHLVKACLLSHDLHKDSDLRHVIKKALGFSLPAGLAEFHIQQLEQQQLTPSKSTLSKARLVMDMGFMLHKQLHTDFENRL
eukprot:10932127-Alexandrium_andersonii.AAC.1